MSRSTAKSLVSYFTTVDHIHVHGGQQGFSCDGMQMTRTIALIASFELLYDFALYEPPRGKTNNVVSE